MLSLDLPFGYICCHQHEHLLRANCNICSYLDHITKFLLLGNQDVGEELLSQVSPQNGQGKNAHAAEFVSKETTPSRINTDIISIHKARTELLFQLRTLRKQIQLKVMRCWQRLNPVCLVCAKVRNQLKIKLKFVS